MIKELKTLQELKTYLGKLIKSNNIWLESNDKNIFAKLELKISKENKYTLKINPEFKYLYNFKEKFFGTATNISTEGNNKFLITILKEGEKTGEGYYFNIEGENIIFFREKKVINL